MQKFKETGDSRYIYRNELDKVCSQNDMVYEDFKDLPRIASEKVLHKKAFVIASNPQYNVYNLCGLALIWSMNSLIRWIHRQ